MNKEHENSNQNYLIEGNETEVHDEVWVKLKWTESEGVIHRDITENETERNMDTFEEVIYECPHDTSTNMMENNINENLNDNNKNNLNDLNETGLDDEEG